MLVANRIFDEIGLVFFDELAGAHGVVVIETLVEVDTPVAVLADALKQWEGNEFSRVSPERDDLSFNLCFGGESPLDEEFVTLARRVFSAVLQHETVEEA